MISAKQIPNILTIIRILLILPFAVAVYSSRYTEALFIFFIAGLSDGIDGFLARHYNWKSRFGAIADPLADKLLLITAYIMLVWTQHLPVWLLVMILGRDLLIVIGALLYHYFVSHYEIRPSLLGKACTLIQIVYVLALMIDLAGWPMPVWAIEYGLHLVTVITFISGAHYVGAWGSKAWRIKSKQKKRAD
jgi:cardiolipin synthase